jgi:ATP-binding cassette subfamily B protein
MAAAQVEPAQPAAAPAAIRAVPWSFAWRLVGLAGRGPLASQAGLAVAQALLPLAGLVAMQQLVDAVADGIAGRVAAEAAMRAATWATFAAGAIACLGHGLRSASTLLAEAHGRELTDAATLHWQRHAAALDLAEFDRPAFHELLQRASAEATQRPVRLVQDGLAVLVAGIGLLTMAIVLAAVAAWLPVVVALTTLPLAWSRRRHARLRAEWHRDHVGPQRDSSYAAAVLVGRATAKDVRALRLGGFWLARAAALRQGLRDSLRALAGRRGRDEWLVATCSSVGLFVAYYWLAQTALAGGLTLGGLVLQAQAAQRAQNGVRDLIAALAGVREHRLLLQPLGELAALRAQLVAVPPARTPPPGPLAIAGDGVSFRYAPAPADTLRALTFAIAPGERIAVVGANGSGKSTFVKLLARLYAPGAGVLHSSGVDLAHVDPDAFRARVAVLWQDATLFELTLRENLALGTTAPAASDGALWRALAVVGLDQRVRALPQQLDTPCSSRHAGGVDWSTGEARRLLLARALAQPADLCLLDEPSLALDGDALARLVAHLAAADRTRTLVVVDHRPQLLGIVDRVFLFERGALAAIGTPAALRDVAAFRSLFPPAVPG